MAVAKVMKKDRRLEPGDQKWAWARGCLTVGSSRAAATARIRQPEHDGVRDEPRLDETKDGGCAPPGETGAAARSFAASA